MSFARRGTTPSLETSQQTHIDDLVQRNRTLDHTIRKLKDELAQEKSRAKSALQDIQQRWHAEQREWREGCDTLQACHRIAQLRTVVELETVRMDVLNEQDALRREKAAALQREFMITKFQVTEGELERRIEDLEDELEELTASREEERRTLKGEIKELATHLKLQEGQFTTAEQGKEALQTELNELHKSVAEQQILSESAAAKLERASLQYEGERTKNLDLQRANDELKHTINDLKRQLDKWQSLETKGGAEVETLRKKRVELEVEVQALQGQLAKREEEEGKAVEAEKRKLQKLKQNLTVWREHSESVQSELEDVKKQLAKAEREVKRLKTELDVERTKTRPSSQEEQSPILSEDEVAHQMSQASPSSPPAPSGSRTKASKPASKQASRSSRKNPSAEVPTDDDVQEVQVTRNKGKGKAKAVESGMEPAPKASRRRENVHNESKVAQDSDTEIEEIPREAITKKATKKNVAGTEDESQPRGKRKRKASPAPDVGEDVVEESSGAPAKRKKQNADVEPPAKANGAGRRRNAAPPSRAESITSTVTTDGQTTDAGKVKKMRKINLFPNTATALPANLFGTQNDALGLNIPTVLSPLKTDAVPRASSILSRTLGKRG